MTTPTDAERALLRENLELFVRFASDRGYRATYANDNGRIFWDDQRLIGMFDAFQAARALPVDGLDAERLDWLEARLKKGLAKGFKRDSWSYDTDKTIRQQLDSAIAKQQEPS